MGMTSEDVFQIFKIVDRAVGQVKNKWPSDHAFKLIAAVGCRWLGGFKLFGNNDRIRAFGESVDLSGDFAVRLAGLLERAWSSWLFMGFQRSH